MTTLTYYVALPFIRADDGAMVPGEAIECPNAETAILQAEFLSQAAGNVGTIAFTNVRPRCVPPGTADIGPNCITGLWLCRHGPARPWPWKAPKAHEAGVVFYPKGLTWIIQPKSKSSTARMSCGSKLANPKAGTKSSIIKPNRNCRMRVNPLPATSADE